MPKIAKHLVYKFVLVTYRTVLHRHVETLPNLLIYLHKIAATTKALKLATVYTYVCTIPRMDIRKFFLSPLIANPLTFLATSLSANPLIFTFACPLVANPLTSANFSKHFHWHIVNEIV